MYEIGAIGEASKLCRIPPRPSCLLAVREHPVANDAAGGVAALQAVTHKRYIADVGLLFIAVVQVTISC